MSESSQPFDLVSYIWDRAVAAGLPRDKVAAEVKWAMEYVNEAPEQAIERIKRQAMRHHPFVGPGPYCMGWGPEVAVGTVEVGMIIMRTQCGYPADLHPLESGDGTA
jgi:hypothetical protein